MADTVTSLNIELSCWDILYIAWFKQIDSILYIYISWTKNGVWMIYITFERGGSEFSNVTARALV